MIGSTLHQRPGLCILRFYSTNHFCASRGIWSKTECLRLFQCTIVDTNTHEERTEFIPLLNRKLSDRNWIVRVSRGFRALQTLQLSFQVPNLKWLHIFITFIRFLSLSFKWKIQIKLFSSSLIYFPFIFIFSHSILVESALFF